MNSTTLYEAFAMMGLRLRRRMGETVGVRALFPLAQGGIRTALLPLRKHSAASGIGDSTIDSPGIRLFVAGVVWVVALALTPGPALGQEVLFGRPGVGRNPGQFCEIAHDSIGNLHVAYYEAERGALKYAFGIVDPPTGNITWSIQTVDDSADVGTHCDIAVDSAGRPAISYHDATSRTLKVAYDQNNNGNFEQNAIPIGVNSGGFAEIQTVDASSSFTGTHTSIVFDDDDNMHISYKDVSNLRLRYATFNGTSFGIETADDPPEEVGDFSSIVVDSRQAVNIPYIFYQDVTNQDLLAVRRLGGTWFKLPAGGAIDPNRETGLDISAVITPANDRIFISYKDEDISSPGSTFLRMAIVDDLLPPSLELVISCSDNPIIPCGIQVVTGLHGSFSSIALDINGAPLIAHYDETRGELILDRRIDGEFPAPMLPALDRWEFDLKPETSGVVGLFSSIDQFTRTDPTLKIDIDAVRVTSYDASRQGLRISQIIDGELATGSATGSMFFEVASGSNTFLVNESFVPFIDGAKVGEFSSLGIDSVATPVCAFYDNSIGSLLVTRRSGGAGSPWETPTLIDNSDAVRGQDVGLIALNDPRINPANFQETGLFVSMQIDATDVQHIAYYDALRTKLRYATHRFGSPPNFHTIDPLRSRGEFATQDISDDESTYAVAYYQAFDPDFASIAAMDPIGNGPRLRVAVGDGADTWQIESVDAAGDVGRFCSVAFDATNTLHVAYFDQTNFSLKYGVRTAPGVWQTEVVDGGAQFDLVGLYTSIAIDPLTDQPTIAYYDIIGSALKFARLTAGGWVLQTVDESGDVGLHANLFYDSTVGTGFIAYYDQTLGNLKLAVKSPSLPVFTGTLLLDSGADVGLRPSVFANGMGVALVSYYDVENGDLLFIDSSLPLMNRASPAWIQYD